MLIQVDPRKSFMGGKKRRRHGGPSGKRNMPPLSKERHSNKNKEWKKKIEIIERGGNSLEKTYGALIGKKKKNDRFPKGNRRETRGRGCGATLTGGEG